MSSYKVATDFRVIASPVRSKFPRILQPQFFISDLPWEKGGQNWGKSYWPSEPGYGTTDKGELPDTEVGTMEADAIAQCCYARPIIVPHNNKCAGNYTFSSDYNPNLTEFWWKTTSILNANVDEMGMDSRERYSAIHGEGSGSTTISYLEMENRDAMSWKGFWGMIEQVPFTADPTRAGGGAYPNWPNESDLRGYTEVRFKIASTDDTNLYPRDTADFVIVFELTGHPKVYRCWDVGFTERELLQDMKPASSFGATAMGITHKGPDQYGVTQNSPYPRSHPIFFEVRFMAGLLQIKIDSAEIPFTYNLCEYNSELTGQQPLTHIKAIRVIADDFLTFNFAVHPMKFRADAVQRSQPFTLGFTPIAGGVLDIRDDPTEAGPWDGNPDSTSIYPELYEEGSQCRYKVTISNPIEGTYNGIDYSPVTHAYRCVNICYQEVYELNGGQDVELYPEDIQVSHSFNPSELTVTAGATLTFNNFNFMDRLYPLANEEFWGEWANKSGAIAIYIDVRMNWKEDAVNYVGAWTRIFTGYGNLRSSTSLIGGGQSKYVMQCYSRDVAMVKQVWNCPWMDGWNHYYAASYMANQGGVRIGDYVNTDLAFRKSVPLDPFSPSPVLPVGQPDYFLPMGTGGSPLMSFQGGASPWQILSRIGKPRGFMRYFDVFGKLHYEKFKPEVPGAPVRWFQARDKDTSNPISDPPTVAIFNGQVNRDLLEVRNKVTIIGVDAFGPMWNPIVAHRVDELSIDCPSMTIFDPTVFNFVSFDNGLVWMDSIFANEEFAYAAADETFNWLRYPAITAQFSTWMQPDIFPGSWIGINEWKSGLTDGISRVSMALLVMSIGHHIHMGQPPTSSISCRMVPKTL